MKIAHLARTCYPFQPYGGLERHVYQLTLELARLGHRVELYIQPPTVTGQQIDEVAWRKNVGSHYISYDTTTFLRRNSIPDRLINYPLFSLRTGQAVRRAAQPADIVHAHGLAGFGYALHPLPGIPLVLNPHGMEEFKNRSTLKQLAYAPFRSLLRQTARRASATIATDAALVPEVAQFLVVSPDRIALIPNAIALDELDRQADLAESKAGYNRTGSAEDRFLMLSVGRLEANKGFEVMLKALSLVAALLETHQPGWRWLVVGQGQEAEKLKQLAVRLELARRVEFLGSVETPILHRLYEEADLFVHPTLYEGSSLVTLEALAHRKPVIASATGGLPDKIFENGLYENGRLCPPGDTHRLAQRLVEMIALPVERLRKMGEQGRRLVEERFSWTAAAQQTVELYERLLATPPHQVK